MASRAVMSVCCRLGGEPLRRPSSRRASPRPLPCACSLASRTFVNVALSASVIDRLDAGVERVVVDQLADRSAALDGRRPRWPSSCPLTRSADARITRRSRAHIVHQERCASLAIEATAAERVVHFTASRRRAWY